VVHRCRGGEQTGREVHCGLPGAKVEEDRAAAMGSWKPSAAEQWRSSPEVCSSSLVLFAFAPQAGAAPCAPADVSIVQDNAYNDMISSYIQVMLRFHIGLNGLCAREASSPIPYTLHSGAQNI
jgi:hypothetical protein